MKKTKLIINSLLIILLTVFLALGPKFLDRQHVKIMSRDLPLVSVEELSQRPDKYLGQPIEIVGKVELPVKFFKVNGYFLNDCTGRVWVLPKNGQEMVPPNMSYQRVRGKVNQSLVIFGAQVFVLHEV